MFTIKALHVQNELFRTLLMAFVDLAKADKPQSGAISIQSKSLF
jgi:hypothetical protein